MILPIGEKKLNNAFSLVEILLVIIIAGIILALAVPNFSNGYSRFELNSTANDLLRCSRWAQAMAIGQERIYALSFSDDRRSYSLVRAKEDNFEPVNGSLGRKHTIPDLIRLDTNIDRIDFYPDGTIDQAKIKLNSSKDATILSSEEVRGMLMKVDNE